MSTYVCNRCERKFEKRTALCFYCRTDSLYEEGSEQTVSPGDTRSVRAGDVATADEPHRFRTPFKNLNDALQGGFAFPSVVQLAGPPNSGKSTLVLQCIDTHAADTLYIGGEETASEIVRRARRLRLKHINDFSIYCNNHPERIQEEIIRQDPRIVVVDSSSVLQWSMSDSPGPYLENMVVRDMGFFAKKQHEHANRPGRTFLLILISHVVKDGSVAGTKAVEHAVDMTLKIKMNTSRDDDDSEIVIPRPLSKEELAQRDIYTRLRTIIVKKTRSGGAPLVSPTFLIGPDGFHEYPARTR